MATTTTTKRAVGNDESKAIDDLFSLLFALLRSPNLAFAGGSGSSPSPSPAEMVSLLLGVSMALMFCGSVTFFIGFVMMPWVVGMIFFLYFVGLISGFFGLGRGFLFQRIWWRISK